MSSIDICSIFLQEISQKCLEVIYIQYVYHTSSPPLFSWMVVPFRRGIFQSLGPSNSVLRTKGYTRKQGLGSRGNFGLSLKSKTWVFDFL